MKSTKLDSQPVSRYYGQRSAELGPKSALSLRPDSEVSLEDSLELSPSLGLRTALGSAEELPLLLSIPPNTEHPQLRVE